MRTTKFILLLILFASKVIGQDRNKTLDVGARNLISTNETKVIDGVYEQAEVKINNLQADIVNLKKEKQKSQILEEVYRRKIDTLNSLVTFQANLLVEKDKIISQQKKAIERKDEIITEKDEIIKNQDQEKKELLKRLDQKDSIIIAIQDQLAGFVPIDKPEKKDIINFYGKGYKANENIMSIEFDSKNKPIIRVSDSIKIVTLYSYALSQDRNIVLTSTKNIDNSELIKSSSTGMVWEDKFVTANLSEILKAYILTNLHFTESNIRIAQTKDDYGKRVFISLSKKN